MQKAQKIILCWVLLFGVHMYAQWNTKAQVGLSVSALMGTQSNLLNIALTTGGVVQYNDFANEIGGGIGVDVAITRYGVFAKHLNFLWEGYWLTGIQHSEPTFFYAGTLNSLPLENLRQTWNPFNGIGFGIQRSYSKGRLAPFDKKLGVLILRNSWDNHVNIIRSSNDFRGGPFRGGGTDQGETGAFAIAHYIQNTTTEEIHQLGVDLSLFTPVPDYARNPENIVNSDLGSHPVLYGKKPFDKLFLGNLFVSYGYVHKNWRQKLAMGVDSKKLGAFTQNKLHDSFGLYPRFAWPTNQKDKLYFQLESSYMYVE